MRFFPTHSGRRTSRHTIHFRVLARAAVLMPMLAMPMMPGVFAADVLVSAGSTWKYLDDGSDQGAAWREISFNETAWRSGRAQLGYGDGDEVTVISYGTNAANKHITTYFRLAFDVVNPSAYTDLTLELLRDEGAVVYLNGREVVRSNMPAGAINYRTPASASVGPPQESTFYPSTLAVSNLLSGANVLAVEVHQMSATNNSDCSFDLRLTGSRSPPMVALLAPPQGAAHIGGSTALNVAVTNPAGGAVAVTFYGRVAPPTGADFTLVAIPDTQFYVSSLNGGTPYHFTSQTDWIVSNRLSRNIAFVTHLGDCVQNGDNGGTNSEWMIATNALYRLENPITTLLAEGIPYGVAVGNHDQSPEGKAGGTTTFYNQFFGEAHFAGRSYYGGHYSTNNDTHYELFSASGLDFIVLHLEYNTAPDSSVMGWASSLLQTYRDRRAIVVSHYIINADGSFGTQGALIYAGLKANTNLFLMLCGHVTPEEGRRQDTFNGNTIHTLLSDYQTRSNGGSGWMRIMEFSPSNNVIRVKTHSPALNQWEADTNSQFTVDYNMQSGPAFTALGTTYGIPSGGGASFVWPGLAERTDYQWFVTVSDGVNTTTSPMGRFRTASNAPPIVSLAGHADSLSSGTNGTITLDTTASDEDDGISRIELYGNNAKLAETTNNPVRFIWNDVPPGAYTFRVVARDLRGQQATSAPVTITVTGPPPVAAPADFTAVAVSNGPVQLFWTDRADNEIGFLLERSTNGAAFAPLATVPANVTSYADASVQPAQAYCYRLSAHSAWRRSEYASLVLNTTPPVDGRPSFVCFQFDRTARILMLSWPNTTGRVYRVVYKANLSEPAWTDLSPEITASSPTARWQEPVADDVLMRMFRVRVVR